MAILSRAQIFDAGKIIPGSQRRVVRDADGVIVRDENGKPMIERLPPGPRWRKWVDAHGNVKRVPYCLSDGKLNRDREAAMEVRQYRAGSVPYDVCPLRDDRLATEGTLRGIEWPGGLSEPCELFEYDPAGGKRRRTCGPERACPHTEWIIAERQRATSKARADRLARENEHEERERRRMELLTESTIAQKELLDRLVSAQESKSKGKAK